MLGLWGKLDCAIDIYIDLWYLNLMSVECFFFFLRLGLTKHICDVSLRSWVQYNMH